ncbi:MAG: DNA replication and repair protein RecF [Bacteroidales bacterium]|nr:DNA replication and repair protein RecF [Bacteroidales bacterium]
MYLKKISIQNFKNIGQAAITFSPALNCISGDNGEGKTNLLDAIFYLSMTKSYFRSAEQFTRKIGEKTMIISGEYISGDGTGDLVAVMLDGEEKQVRLNKKNYTKFSDHIGKFPIVMISPSDTSLINDSAEARRRFMNMMLSQTDREYMRSLMSYNKLLLYRNRLLKEEAADADLLDTITVKMVPFATYIYEQRKALCEELQTLASDYYARLSDGKEAVSLQYQSDLARGTLGDLLEKNLERDKFLKYTSAGPQRDEIVLKMNDCPIKSCGSQGQQKTFLLAVKLAQFVIMRRHYGFAPILLLDDVFDKLDSGRVEFLLKTVASEDFGQIFVTDCNKVRLADIVAGMDVESAMFTVKGGVFSLDADAPAPDAPAPAAPEAPEKPAENSAEDLPDDIE